MTDHESARRERVEALRRIPVFSACSERDLARVASSMVEVHADTGDVLVRAGEAPAALVLIEEGSVSGAAGDALGPGEAIGQEALLAGAVSAPVVAQTSVRGWSLDAVAFRALLDQSPSLARSVIRALARRADL